MSRASFIVNPFVRGNTLILQPSGEQYSYTVNSMFMGEFLCSMIEEWIEKIWMNFHHFLHQVKKTNSHL